MPGTSDSASQNECSRPPKIEHLPFRAGGFHFGFENITVVLRHDRVLATVHHADRGLDVARLGRKRCQQIAVQADDRLKIGAGARELKHIAAAETEADRGLALEIADLALVAFAAQGIERGSDAAAPFEPIGAQCVGEVAPLPAGRREILPPPYMSATKATYLLPAIVAARLMASSLTPSQFGDISSSGRRPLTLLIINQRAGARGIARLIIDPLDSHRFSPSLLFIRE